MAASEGGVGVQSFSFAVTTLRATPSQNTCEDMPAADEENYYERYEKHEISCNEHRVIIKCVSSLAPSDAMVTPSPCCCLRGCMFAYRPFPQALLDDVDITGVPMRISSPLWHLQSFRHISPHRCSRPVGDVLAFQDRSCGVAQGC